MRFLHTSDWHLGRIFHGVHLTDDQAHLLAQFIGLIDDIKPDAIVIAGDVYDRSVPPTEAVKLLDETLSQILMDYKTPVIMIAGNHDSPERLGFGSRLLARQGLHLTGLFDTSLQPVTIMDKHGPVHFVPVPFVEPPVVREKWGLADIANHDQAMAAIIHKATAIIPAGERKVLVGHAYLTGGEKSESERPLSIGGTDMIDFNHFDRFDYVALGHLHQPQSIGKPHIRYSGSLLKYSFSEVNHKKSITLVEMDDTGKTEIQSYSLTPRRDVRRIEGELNNVLRGPRQSESKEDYLLVSLLDTGAVLDAMGRLREVYPNVLHIERPHLSTGGELRGPASDHRKLSEKELFSSFFEQVTGETLTDEQGLVFSDTVEDLFRQKREVAS
ncbi:exonuclease SbcCD subunit D [Heliobacterium chlorum]|uniref:Nuclease SbcCD subunit D n=1 Tax=Heliobacterium chlorum TaxID=2698 RepID=A0ABR7T2R2_HELCL|nr:exonuclease SbcCD subunit D [Heliobacterium chlorum]MBC9784417.1 exonuclease SbcCD subunit D [Heliobacterium chlorum]